MIPENKNPEDKGKHYSIGKPELHQLPRWVLWQVAKVCMYGAIKYDRWNWRQGMSWSELFDSAQRHQDDWWEGANWDIESELHHLDHAICDLMFLRWMVRFRPDKDDRPPQTPLQVSLYTDGMIGSRLLAKWHQLAEERKNAKVQNTNQGGESKGKEA